MIWFVLACTAEPEPAPEAPPVQAVETPVETAPEPLATQQQELPPGVDLPWPAELPCAQFQSVQLTQAWLSDPQGEAIVSPGHETARYVAASGFSPKAVGQLHPESDRAHLQAQCSDPREALHWVCTLEGCTLEVQRIAERPEPPSAWADADFGALSRATPKPGDPKLRALVEQGKGAMIGLLQGCQAQHCNSQELVTRLEGLSTAGEATLRQTAPWKMAYTEGAQELLLSCTPQSCQLQVFDAQGYLGRLDISAEATTLYLPGGDRLDYRESRNGPRVAFTGTLAQAPASP